MNEYSSRWFDTFLESVPARRTDAETSFVRRQLPVPEFGRVLDLCCGAGRHSIRLARTGYRVVAVDRDAAVVRAARRRGGRQPAYVVADMARLPLGGGGFDGILLLWQSFGHGSPTANRKLLGRLSSQLRPGGRLILDLYHREFFRRHQGVRRVERAGRVVTETTTMRGRRLEVRLTYDDGWVDAFAWELFTPSELVDALADHGLRARRICRRFEEELPASTGSPRFQAVFERR